MATIVPSESFAAQRRHSALRIDGPLWSSRRKEKDNDDDGGGGGALVEKLASLFDRKKNGKDIALPIRNILPDICTSLDSKPNLLFVAPPAAGKSTKVPLALLWDHLKKSNNGNQEQQRSSKTTLLIVVKPRVAARSAAVRMAKLLEESVGDTVGLCHSGRVPNLIQNLYHSHDGWCVAPKIATRS